ncbi:MAG: type II toxin-antitoxin system RatA family toxin [Armatimonadota bacterium]
MPTVESKTTINAPPADVYAAARDRIAELADFLDNVSSIEVLEREGNRAVTKWAGSVEAFGRNISFDWTEEDQWDDDALTCTFKQTGGDFDVYEGTWSFSEAEEGCESVLRLEFAKDIPGVGALIQGLLQQKVQEMSDATLAGLKKMVEGG